MQRGQKLLKWASEFDFKSIKMTRTFYLFTLLFFINCSSIEDCVRGHGNEISVEVEVPFFNKINVQSGVGLVLKQSDVQTVTIKSRTEVLKSISYEVIDETLFLRQNESCFWNQSYGETSIEISIPNLFQLQSTTEQNIRSEGILNFDNFSIIAFEEGKEAASGNFYLNLNGQYFKIESNTVASFFLSGNVNTFNINYYSDDGRCDASQLNANEINVFHRSTNDIIVRPQTILKGNLYSTGNLIYKSEPEILEVNSYFTGQLIYQP